MLTPRWLLSHAACSTEGAGRGTHDTSQKTGQRGEEAEQWGLIPLRDEAAYPRHGIFARAHPGQAGVWLSRNVQGPQLPSGVDFKIKNREGDNKSFSLPLLASQCSSVAQPRQVLGFCTKPCSEQGEGSWGDFIFPFLVS